MLLEAVASWEKIIPVVLKLVSMATVTDPDMRYTGNSTGKAQEVLPGLAVLICNQETLICRITLVERQRDTASEPGTT